MKIKLIDFGLKKDHYPFRPHENDAGADVYMPYDYTLKPGVLCLLRTIFLETTYASCSGSTPASISNFVFLRIFGAFKASPSLSPTLPMKR